MLTISHLDPSFSIPLILLPTKVLDNPKKSMDSSQDNGNRK